MAVYGNVGNYVEEQELFEDYIDRVDAFIKANKIADTEKASLFLSLVGPKTYKLLKDLVSPRKPSALSYAELVTCLRNHYNPKPIVIAERFKFWKSHQGEEELIAQYVVRLKQLASTCDFGEFYDDAMRDRLVSGLNTNMSRTQTYLLSQDALTFDSACKKVCS